MNKTVLFLGGPWHGQVRSLPASATSWRVAPDDTHLDFDLGNPPITERELAFKPVEYVIYEVADTGIGASCWVACQKADMANAIAIWGNLIRTHMLANGRPL